MIYKDFQGKKLSLLGFGTMRLPQKEDDSIDEAQVQKMTDLALSEGVNYFDTAYPYHGGLSEVVMGKVLKSYPRESYYLATKYPGHQVAEKYDPAAIFEEQLQKCGVDYFDFYLLHNVSESSVNVYLDPQWGIVDYFLQQKRLGRIKHLGFSSHGGVDMLREFLNVCGKDMEFCQIQLNWLDWTLQDAKTKVELLNEFHIPIWVMEPVRGGRLCKLEPAVEAALHKLRPEDTVPAWGFRFLQDIPGVTMILSGMSNIEQMQQNIDTFRTYAPLTAQQRQTLLAVAEGMKSSVPCTGCKYCTAECPMGLDIPLILSVYNELRFAPVVNASMRLEFLPEDKKPSACLGCGACAHICPQGIDIPAIMKEMTQKLDSMPKWLDISREREEAAKKNKNT